MQAIHEQRRNFTVSIYNESRVCYIVLPYRLGFFFLLIHRRSHISIGYGADQAGFDG
jgi:hypothetical protein